MSETIEQICLRKGVKLTDQRKIIAKVLSESKENYGESDHPDVDELYKRVSKIDSRVSIATVYRTAGAAKSASFPIGNLAHFAYTAPPMNPPNNPPHNPIPPFQIAKIDNGLSE